MSIEDYLICLGCVIIIVLTCSIIGIVCTAPNHKKKHQTQQTARHQWPADNGQYPTPNPHIEPGPDPYAHHKAPATWPKGAALDKSHQFHFV